MTGNPQQLLYPMLAMFLWTFLVLLRNAQVRLAAMRKRELSREYFQLFQGATAPEPVVKTGNHVRNLCEFPPLFYIACLTVLVLHRSDAVYVSLAWAYVALRIGHSLVHLTVNRVTVRFAFFLLSQLVLLVMWLRLGLHL